MNSNNGNPELKSKDEPQVTKGFKFRVIMTLVFFVLALFYIIWLLKII
ncbi:hypothetical protein ARNL5_03561 [Anaerolineae bacterium]|nr:hypothetical protein ARNL5_03561 [Anaerolineae bacterium]